MNGQVNKVLIASAFAITSVGLAIGANIQQGVEYVQDGIVVAFKPAYTPLNLTWRQGVVVTAIEEVDRLNNEYKVIRMWPLFPNAKERGEPDMAGFYSMRFISTIRIETVLDAYEALECVEHVEAIGIHGVSFNPNDDSIWTQWGITKIDARQAWDITHGSYSVPLGIADSGVDWDHPDLYGNIWINLDDPIDGVDNDGNGYIDDCRGWDWVDGVNGAPGEDDDDPDNNPMDFHGHGTHVSGIASAMTDNITGIAGTGFDCSIMCLRIGWRRSDGYGVVRMDFAASAFYYAANSGAKAINCSWGSSNSGGIETAANYASDHGVLIVSAAGNDSSDDPPYLCTRSDVIAVAATNANDVKAWFSNFGTWVDVSAPGVDINSTMFDDIYGYMSGTSMAAPHVTGLAGLICAAAPSLTRDEVQLQIVNSTEDIDSLNPGYEGLLGSGRINAWYAVDDFSSRYITVISPNGGEVIFRGRSQHFAWDFYGNVGNQVIIDLYKGGAFYTNLCTVNNINWANCQIPHETPVDSDYQVKISSLDYSVSDMSDSYFSIVAPVELDTIPIYTATELQLIGSDDMHPRDGYYVLMNDIDAGVIPNWQPIGSDYQHYFRGTLNGRGFRVYDLQIDRRSQSLIGLFSVLMSSGVIKNLAVADDGIYGWGSVGALVGECAGTIINCHAYIDDLESKGGDNTGGLVGEITGTGRIINCSVSSLNDGDVEADSAGTSPDDIGGLAGTNARQIKWCWSNVGVDAAHTDCEADEVGGLVGQNVGSIIECYTGNPRIDGHNQVGGIAGIHYSSGTITDCLYSDAGAIDSDHGAYGGIAGQTEGASIIDRSLSNAYVGGGGALVGEHYATVSNSFWNRDRTGIDQATGNSGGTVINCNSISDTEAKLQVTYISQYGANWDFSNVWAISNGLSYPRLRGIGLMLLPPTGLLASQDQSDGVHLSWNQRTYLVPNPGADSLGPYNAVYRIFRSTVPNANPPELELTAGWQSGITFLDTTALPGASYYYYVKAAATINGARESGFSNSVQGQRAFEPLPAPTDVSASDGLENIIYIAWSSVPNANFYRAFRSDSPSGTKIPLGDWQSQLYYTDVPEFSDSMYYYWVKSAIDNSGGRQSDYGGPDSGYYVVPTGIADHDSIPIPEVFSLKQNYPNPFNSQCAIEYALPNQAHVTITVYDILGRRVAVLADEQQSAGFKSVIWDAGDQPSGMYFYKIQAGEFIETKKMLLLK